MTNNETYTIKTLAEAANAITEEAGIKLKDSAKITPADVAAYLEMFIEEEGEDAPVDPDSAQEYLEAHNEWVIL